MGPPRSAGVIIIGDEVLSGSVNDTNSHFISQRLRQLGIRLLKVSVLPDELDVLATEIQEFSGKFDVVITCGGVGPTHDDLTYEAVAKAFNIPLEFNSQIGEMIAQKHGGSATDISANPCLKMAFVPASANTRFHRILDTENTTISKPIVQVNNVFIFPGSPINLQRAFLQLEPEIKGDSKLQFHYKEIHLRVPETKIVPQLTRAVEQFRKTVTFGSYPNCGHWEYDTKLTLDSTSAAEVEAAHRFLLRDLQSDWLVGGDDPCTTHLMEDLTKLTSSSELGLGPAMEGALKVLNECCDSYTPEKIALCFNGGKDATVLLHIACTVIRSRFPEWKDKPLQAFWVHSAEPFPEVLEFVHRMVDEYKLELRDFGNPIQTALGEYLRQKPQVEVALLGTRRTDPHSGNLRPFQVTDPGWPKVIRVSPILEWTYANVWTFLRDRGLPYCSLYDQGDNCYDEQLAAVGYAQRADLEGPISKVDL